jgi:hypothetical protein
MEPTVQAESPPSELVSKRAGDVVVGDVVAPEFLPVWGSLPGEVIFVRGYRASDADRVLVAFRQADGWHDSEVYLSDRELMVTPAPDAEVTGHNFGRADDAEPSGPVAGHGVPHFKYHVSKVADEAEAS